MNKLTERFHRLKENGEKAFVAYIMGGDGGMERLKEDIFSLQASGADVIEVGVPFSDPVADGPVIQDAGLRALEAGTTLSTILETLRVIKAQVRVPLILMTYINPVLQYGVDKFALDSENAGVSGCIFPDLPLEEEGLVTGALSKTDISVIRLASLTSPEERLKRLAEDSEGFIYAVTVKGVTGERAELNAAELEAKISKLKTYTNTPVLAGFGISTPSLAKKVLPFCDGVIVGSKIVNAFHQGKREEVDELIKGIKGLALTVK
ncbi:tryptophan synthase subunit alpha [Peribacillus deserti]|uniref:Tryptophan synthase alpha chain n=1 Tax=Peribacillus deserti TaxID=673318 RepID=A0A2N5M6E3_9BACI|nr:tryptophan synthase subunit alpha [Peribacillus deserti]PLT29934.1 tryptophan synthase subunit alpha [Peribacillus deserti]